MSKIAVLIPCYNEAQTIEKVVKAVTEIYMDSWNDKSQSNYLQAVKELKEEIEAISDTKENYGKLELSFVGKNGNKITRYYEQVGEETGAILRNILSDTLEDHSDLSVNDKIAILLEMIEEQLG